ncbi:AraC family transcriptional regulator [Steroidobacter sp. S1-65]|uniref:AraC family transcriptional regulator n=1 Tax=Steroidobacter gossypii TaxID=2805490 RepID=A0ABS1X029_9GAMM|nr:AraC family transcriptional regulator [Steroidobacter gossypii]MBM0106580.1 AraC family transcriptional regulator [Steroidobacter gossypii]
MATLVRKPSEPTFWHDDTLPFVEARSIDDGRTVRYGKHAHETFSIGVVTNGRCIYLNGKTRQAIGAGTVVLMNPGDAHACNPDGSGPWSYRMLYFDVSWLTAIQQTLGSSCSDGFGPFLATATTDPSLYAGLYRLHDVLTDPQADSLKKHCEAQAFMTTVQQVLSPAPSSPSHRHRGLARAAEFIRDNYMRSIKLEEICAAADLSPSYLIRAFDDKYGMTPHAYVTNCRIEFSRSQLRRGRPIAEVALAAGFSDQAHLQRSFKRLVAATPGQYRS